MATQPVAADDHHLRFHAPVKDLTHPFGSGGFGALAERVARFFGTPQYLIGQSLVVAVWIVLNALGVVRFDLYPFILLNLAFSLQAAYAAPLILLAQTRQADRDKLLAEADAHHREDLARHQLQRQEQSQRVIDTLQRLLEQNTVLTEQVQVLTEQIHGRVCSRGAPEA
ncbi:MAG TPA: DUF1003 domain-containing protein [Gaiellales bacterium]|nr:DUF1003 domain-containing protein [Gaiellales bacterium]